MTTLHGYTATHLIEAVASSLCEKGLQTGVPQHIVLGSPVDDLDIAAYWQGAVAHGHHVRL